MDPERRDERFHEIGDLVETELDGTATKQCVAVLATAARRQ